MAQTREEFIKNFLAKNNPTGAVSSTDEQRQIQEAEDAFTQYQQNDFSRIGDQDYINYAKKLNLNPQGILTNRNPVSSELTQQDLDTIRNAVTRNVNDQLPQISKPDQDIEQMRLFTQSSPMRPLTPSEEPVVSRIPLSVQSSLKSSAKGKAPVITPEQPKIEQQPNQQDKPKELSEDELLQQAQDKASFDRLIANLGAAATQIGSGFASLGAGSPVKVDTSGFAKLAESADQPVQDLKTKLTMALERQKRDAANEEVKLKKELNDPNSSISKVTRKLASRLGLSKDFGDNATAAQYKNAGLDLDTMHNMQMRNEQLKIQRDALASEKESKFKSAQAERYQKLAVTDPRFAPLARSLNAFDELGTQLPLAEKNPMVYNAIGVQAAKAYGEVGNLSESDVTRYIGRRDIAGKVQRAANAFINGTMTAEDAKYMQEAFKALREKKQESLNKIYEEKAQLMSRNTKIPIEDARSLVNPNYVPRTEAPSEEMVKIRAADGRIGSIPKSKLNEALKRGATKL